MQTFKVQTNRHNSSGCGCFLVVIGVLGVNFLGVAPSALIIIGILLMLFCGGNANSGD